MRHASAQVKFRWVFHNAPDLNENCPWVFIRIAYLQNLWKMYMNIGDHI